MSLCFTLGRGRSGYEIMKAMQFFYSSGYVQVIWIYLVAGCSPSTPNSKFLCLCTRFLPGWLWPGSRRLEVVDARKDGCAGGRHAPARSFLRLLRNLGWFLWRVIGTPLATLSAGRGTILYIVYFYSRKLFLQFLYLSGCFVLTGRLPDLSEFWSRSGFSDYATT